MFILYFFILFTESKSKYQENFPEGSWKDVFIIWEIECYCFHKFYKSNPFQDGVKTGNLPKIK